MNGLIQIISVLVGSVNGIALRVGNDVALGVYFVNRLLVHGQIEVSADTEPDGKGIQKRLHRDETLLISRFVARPKVRTVAVRGAGQLDLLQNIQFDFHGADLGIARIQYVQHYAQQSVFGVVEVDIRKVDFEERFDARQICVRGEVRYKHRHQRGKHVGSDINAQRTRRGVYDRAVEERADDAEYVGASRSAVAVGVKRVIGVEFIHFAAGHVG